MIITPSTFKVFQKYRSKNWECKNSSLAKRQENPTYEECRQYACDNIASSLTKFDSKLPFIYFMPKKASFNFLVRVGTDVPNNANKKETIINQFEKRDYISFSVITNGNLSHYGLGGSVLFAYEIESESIAHIFPMDSCSDLHAKTEDKITEWPSLWLTLDDLNKATYRLGTYNQITCKTRNSDGNIYLPKRVICIDNVDSLSKRAAKEFGIGITVIQSTPQTLISTIDPFVPSPKNMDQINEIMRRLKAMYGLGF